MGCFLVPLPAPSIELDLKSTLGKGLVTQNLLHSLDPQYGQFEQTPNAHLMGHGNKLRAAESRASRQRSSIKDMQKLAKERGGKCLSKVYVNNSTHLTWQCGVCRNEWDAKPGNIKTGNWCPECGSGLSERICRAFLEQLFERKFPCSRPKWLTNSDGNQMHLDGFSPHGKPSIAFEHHGKQHYKKSSLFHSSSGEFKKRVKMDSLKKKLCLKQNVKLIIIPDLFTITKLPNLKDHIKRECRRLKIPLPKKFLKFEPNLQSAYKPDRLEVLRSIAISKGGYLVSNVYLGNHVPLKFTCSAGHSWSSSPGNIKANHWCPECARIGQAERLRGTINEMHKIAESKGGKCLSKRYTNSKTPLLFICRFGHKWHSPPATINQGGWCRICSNKRVIDSQRDTIENMQKLAKRRKGSCLSKFYVNCKTKLKWECEYGHTWQATPSKTKLGRWCHECAGQKHLLK